MHLPESLKIIWGNFNCCAFCAGGWRRSAPKCAS